MKVYFLLPAYNEEANIEGQISKLTDMAKSLEVDYSVCVVDDGSTDETRPMVEKLAKTNKKIQIKSHPVNGGPGMAFITGFRMVLEQAKDEDLIISMDADNTHSERTIRMMLARAQDGYEMIIASVFAPGGMMIGVPFLRYILTIGCNTLYRVLFPVAGIREYTGFYRCYRVGSLRNAFKRYEDGDEPILTAHGFATAAEILIKLRRIPVFMTEVPMLVRYDKKGGKSKLRIIPTIREHLRIIFSNSIRRHII